MALDLNTIQAKLNSLEKSTTRTNNLWRPEAGDTQIRLVPYKYGTDPFVELYFCYNIGQTRSILSPITFGKDCPINEAAAQLRSTGNKEDFELARKIQPKLRIYAPVLVRSKEGEGVKFWGFGKLVYQSLLNYFLDADYGDLSHAETGRDVVVKYSPPSGNMAFGSTSIMPKPNQTPLASTPEGSKKIVDSVLEISEVFAEKSYDDVNQVWEAFLNQDSDGAEETNGSLGSEKSFATTAATKTPPTTAASVTEPADLKDLDQQFDDVFGSNSEND